MSAPPHPLGSGRSLDQHALVFCAVLEIATAPGLGAQFGSNLQGLPPLSVLQAASSPSATVRLAQPAPGSTRARCQILLLLFLTAAVTYHQTLELVGPGRPVFSSTSAKTSSVLSALTAYWKYPSLRKTENLTSKKYLGNVQGVEVMGLFIVKAAGLPC